MNSHEIWFAAVVVWRGRGGWQNLPCKTNADLKRETKMAGNTAVLCLIGMQMECIKQLFVHMTHTNDIVVLVIRTKRVIMIFFKPTYDGTAAVLIR